MLVISLRECPIKKEEISKNATYPRFLKEHRELINNTIYLSYALNKPTDWGERFRKSKEYDELNIVPKGLANSIISIDNVMESKEFVTELFAHIFGRSELRVGRDKKIILEEAACIERKRDK